MGDTVINDELLMEADAAFEKQLEESADVVSETKASEAIKLVNEPQVIEKESTYDVGELRLKVRTLIKKMIEDEFAKMIKKLGLHE